MSDSRLSRYKNTFQDCRLYTKWRLYHKILLLDPSSTNIFNVLEYKEKKILF